MPKRDIEAQRITKPIQLLAAWLIGLVSVNGSFLGAAVTIGESWERSTLVIAAVANVPIFLLALFILQTKFRPELQEDAFYSQYINRKTNQSIDISRFDLFEKKLAEINVKIEDKFLALPSPLVEAGAEKFDWDEWNIAVNAKLPFYEDFLRDLESSAIPVKAIFGKDSSVGMPSRAIIFFSEEMPAEYVLAILKVAARHPFDAFDFWLPYREAGENEDVYAGGYGESKNSINFSDKVRSAIGDARDRSDLARLKA